MGERESIIADQADEIAKLKAEVKNQAVKWCQVEANNIRRFDSSAIRKMLGALLPSKFAGVGSKLTVREIEEYITKQEKEQ